MNAVRYRQSSAVQRTVIALVLLASFMMVALALLLSGGAPAPSGAAGAAATAPAGILPGQGLNDQDALGPIYPPGSFSEFAAPQGPNDQDALGQI